MVIDNNDEECFAHDLHDKYDKQDENKALKQND